MCDVMSDSFFAAIRPANVATKFDTQVVILCNELNMMFIIDSIILELTRTLALLVML